MHSEAPQLTPVWAQCTACKRTLHGALSDHLREDGELLCGDEDCQRWDETDNEAHAVAHGPGRI